MNENTRQKIAISMWSPIRLAYGLLPVITVLDRYGIKPDRMLDQAGIARFGLMDPGYTISIEQELAFQTAVMRALPDPALSLEIAREYRLRGFSVLGLAMQASANPLQMLRLILRYPRLSWAMFDGSLTLGTHTLRVIFQPQPRLGAAEGFLAERDFACALVLFEEATESPFPFESVSFRHPCAGDPAAYEAFFHCPVNFGAKQTELRCSRAATEQPLPHADAIICAFYTAQCERMSKNMDQPFLYAEAVRNRLLGSDVIPDLATLASSMFLTPRTLQRRLRAENASFSDLLREARELRATQMLSEGRQNMEQIAATLGFSDAAAFSHAFKSWTGHSPREWRQTQIPADPALTASSDTQSMRGVLRH